MTEKFVSAIRVCTVVVAVALGSCCGGCATDYSRIVPFAPYAPVEFEEMSVYQYTEYPVFLAYQQIYAYLSKHNPYGVYDKVPPIHGLSIKSSNFNETLARAECYPLGCRKSHVLYLYLNNDAERLSALANDLRGSRIGDYARDSLNKLKSCNYHLTSIGGDDELIVRTAVLSDTRKLLRTAMNLNGSNGSIRAYRAAIKRLDQLDFWGKTKTAERANLLRCTTKDFKATSLYQKHLRGGNPPSSVDDLSVYEESVDFKRLLCEAATDINLVVDIIAEGEYTHRQKEWAEALPPKSDAVVKLWCKTKESRLREVLVPKMTVEQIEKLVRFDPRPENRLEIMDVVTNQVVLTWIAQFDADKKVREKAKDALNPKARRVFERNVKREQAEHGTPDDMYRYAETILNEGDKDAGAWWMKKAMSAGSADAAYWLSHIEFHAGNTNEWRVLVKRAADSGHPQACLRLATDVLEQDEQLAYQYLVRAFYGSNKDVSGIAGGVIANLLSKRGVKLSEQQIDILYEGVGGGSGRSLRNFFWNYREQMVFEKGQEYACDEDLEVRQVLSKWQGVLVGYDLRYASTHGDMILPDRVIFVKTDLDYDEHGSFKEDIVYLGKFTYKTVLGAEKEVRMFESVARRKRIAEALFSMGEKILSVHPADLKVHEK